MAQIIEERILSASQSLVVQAIVDGTYFVFEETPSGTIDGVNPTFTLAHTPNPASSLKLRLNGLILKSGASNDYVLSGAIITMANIPQPGDSLVASYTVSPV